jgi:hypothetical protein
METLTLSDYADLKKIEHRDQSDHKSTGWGCAPALWILVAAVLILAIVYCWNKNSNEKVQFSTSLANLHGKIECMEPDVKWLGKQMYGVAQTAAGLVTGVADMKEVQNAMGKTIYQNPVDDLTAQFIYNRGMSRSSSCCGRNNRVFEQTQNYTLASQGVTVTERCGNDNC